MTKNYLLAIATLIGTIVGVGIFTIPYVISKSGIIWLFVYIIALSTIQNYLHKLYAEVVLSTKDEHRLPGYVERYFGSRYRNYVVVVNAISNYGSIIAYIIVGGLFFHQLLSPIFGGQVLAYTAGLFFVEATIVYFGVKTIAGAEFIMTSLLLLAMGLICWKGFSFMQLDNYQISNWTNFFLPYGPIFFAVGGTAAIPQICKLLKNDPRKIASAISWGTYVSAAITTLFVFVVVGVTGQNTTPDALGGLGMIIKNGVITMTLIFGLLAIVTSFLTISEELREVFWWDLKINKNIAWALACLIPFGFYLLGLRDITKIVGLTGSICGGVMGIILISVIMQVKIKAEQPSVVVNKINRPLSYALSVFFLAGLCYEIWSVFF